MGVVYLCRDVVTGDRVALKRLRSPEKGETRPEESWWFHQEARAVALLDHPAIVRARDFGQLADGSPFFVMDVLPGRSVHEWMHTTHLPVGRHLGDGRPGARRRWRTRTRAASSTATSSRRTSCSTWRVAAAAARAPSCSTWASPGCASTATTRASTARAPRRSPSTPGAGTVGWVAPEQIRRQAALVGPGDRSLRARLRDVPRAQRARGLRGQRAGRAARPQAHARCRRHALRDDVPPEAGKFVVRLLEKKPWNRFEFAADARRAWMRIRPAAGRDARGDRAEPPELARGPRSATRGRSRPASSACARPCSSPARRSAASSGARSSRSTSGRAAAGPHRAHRGSRRRQEPHRRVALRRGARARRHDARCARATAASRRRSTASPRPSTRTSGSRAPTAPPSSRRSSRAGRSRKDDDDALTWVAATAEWLRPDAARACSRRSGPTRQALRPRPPGAALRRHQARARAHLARPPGPALARRPALRVAQHVRGPLAPAPRRAPSCRCSSSPPRAARRSPPISTPRCAWRPCAPSGAGRVLELKPLATDDTETLLRAAAAARRRRRAARGRAEPRQPALRAAAALRLGGWRVPHARGRPVPRARARAPGPAHHHRRAVGRARARDPDRAPPERLRRGGAGRRRPRRRAQDPLRLAGDGSARRASSR